MSNALVWFYNDLRLADNPALVNAIESGRPVIPLFIWDENDSDLHTGGAAKWWLHQSLDRLSNRIEELGNRSIRCSLAPICSANGPNASTLACMNTLSSGILSTRGAVSCTMAVALSCQGLWKIYEMGDENVQAVRGFELDI